MENTDLQMPTTPVMQNYQEPELIVKKSGMPPVLNAMLAVLVLIIVAGGTYAISMGVSSSRSITPNAPTSNPKAFDTAETLTTEAFDPNGDIDCSEVPNTAPYGNRCVEIVVLENGEITWAPGAIEAIE